MASSKETSSTAAYKSLQMVDVEDSSHGDDLVTIDFDKTVVSEVVGELEGQNVEELEILQATTTYLKIKLMLSRGVPVVSSFFLSYLGAMIIMLFASHYGYDEGSSDVLAGVTLANLFGNVSLFSIMVGLSTAVETLGSQNFGAKNYEEVGIVLQRAVCILSVVSVPLLFLWLFAGPFFSYCGIDPQVVTIISRLLAIRAFSIPGDVLNIAYEKYLCSMGVTTPTLLYTITQNVVLLILLPTFILGLKLPYQYISVGQVVSIYIGLMVHVYVSLGHDAVKRTLQTTFNRRALAEWKEFIALGIPGAAMICSEWWAFEILAFLASRLGTSSVAAQSLMLQIICLAYMVPLGFSIAVSSLVGNAIGAKQYEMAKELARLSYFIIFSVDFVIALCLYFGGMPFIHFLSNDQQVIDIFESMLLFLSLVPFVDGNQSMSSGIMRGTGKQFIGAITNFSAFYFLGLPCAYYFCFSLNFGVSGLLRGLYVGASTQMIILFIIVLKFDHYVFAPVEVAATTKEEDETTVTIEAVGPKSLEFAGVRTVIDLESGVELATSESSSSSSSSFSSSSSTSSLEVSAHGSSATDTTKLIQ